MEIYTCSLCDLKCSSENTIRIHLDNCPFNGTLYCCQVCQTIFKSLQDVQSHINVEHNELTGRANDSTSDSAFLSDSHIEATTSVFAEELGTSSEIVEIDEMAHEQVVAPDVVETLVACSFCGDTFPSDIHLSAHVNESHWHEESAAQSGSTNNDSTVNLDGITISSPVERKISCQMCPRSFSSNHHLVQHIRARHSGRTDMKSHVCQLCDKKFSTGHHLHQHLVSIHLDKNYVCHICGKRFGKESFLTHHLHHCHDEGFVCTICNKVCSTHHHLEQHICSHGNSGKVQCKFCGKLFRHRNALLQHAKISHAELLVNNFDDDGNMDEDVVVGIEVDDDDIIGSDSVDVSGSGAECDDVYICTFCSKRFDDITVFNKHLVAKHSEYITSHNFLSGESSDGPSSSNVFLESSSLDHDDYSSKKAKKNFLKVKFRVFGRKSPDEYDSKHKRYVCEDCGGRFRKQSRLLEHKIRFHPTPKRKLSSRSSKSIIVDNELRPHVCDDCGKAFKTKSHLNQHIRYHTGEKPFRCDICGQEFHLSGDRNRHVIKMHSDYRPYECEYCHKGFVDRYAMQQHKKMHLKEKSFKCDLCSTYFTNKTQLKTHRSTHH